MNPEGEFPVVDTLCCQRFWVTITQYCCACKADATNTFCNLVYINVYFQIRHKSTDFCAHKQNWFEFLRNVVAK